MRISDSDLIINSSGEIYHLGIKPEQLAETIITVGDPERVKRVSKHFNSIEYESHHREFIVCTGTHHGNRITVLSTGMGTQNIDIVMAELDALVNIDFATRTVNEEKKRLRIIRIGTSGAIQPDINVGSIIISKYAVDLTGMLLFYSYSQTQAEQQLGESFSLFMKNKMPDIPIPAFEASKVLAEMFCESGECIDGITATCNGFYAPQGRKMRIMPKYPSLLDDLMAYQAPFLRMTNFEMETAGYYGLGRVYAHDCCSINKIIANRPRGIFTKNLVQDEDALIEFVLNTLEPL